MNKKILSIIISAIAIVNAKPYSGIKIGYSKIKPNSQVNRINDFIAGGVGLSQINPINNSKNKNAFLFGALFGYKFENKSKHTPYIEGDVEFSNIIVRSDRIDTMINNNANFLENEHIDTKKKFALGFTFGISEQLSEKWSALLGLRVNMNKYQVSAYHIENSGTQLPANYKSKNVWLLGIEPTIGAEYKASEKVAARLTLGYNMQQSKQVFDNYVGDSNGSGATIGAKVKPSAVNVRFSVTYTFG